MVWMRFPVFMLSKIGKNTGTKEIWKRAKPELSPAFPFVHMAKELAKLVHAGCIMLHDTTDLLISSKAMLSTRWKPDSVLETSVKALYGFVMSRFFGGEKMRSE